MKNHKGFTLIELMIVVAIVGIMVAFAVPRYNQYTLKARMAEALAITQEAKTALIAGHAKTSKFVPNYGNLSQRNLEIGLQEHTKYLSENVTAMWVGSRGVRGKDSTSAHIAIILPGDLGLQEEGQGRAHFLSTIEFVNGSYVFVCNDKNAVWRSNIKDENLPSSCKN